MGFYDDMQAIASDVLAEFKQGVVTLTRTTFASSDPATPWVPGSPSTVTYTLDATVKGVSQQFVDGTLIKMTDLEVTAAVFAVEPAASDVMAIDGKAVTVLKTIRIPSAGTAVAHKFIVRA